MTYKKTILITGSGSGIGKAVALELAQKGHTVLATTHHKVDADELNRLALENKISLQSFVLDVTKATDRVKILEYDIDVLINNAGIGETGSLAEIPFDKVRHTFEVNVFGSFELTQLTLKSMMKKDRGTILFVSSLLGRVTAPFFGPYSMSKFAVSSGAEMLRNELSQVTDTVHVSVIEPGAYHTGFNQKMINKKFEWMDEKSYFYKIINKIKDREEKQFRLSEANEITSIVAEVVKAAEADKPKLRYSAPWWQNWGVAVLRVFGK
jgi:short-subunit dehydrogenase